MSFPGPIHHLHDMDITNQLQLLGGAFYTALAGPTPHSLVAEVPPGILNPPQVLVLSGLLSLLSKVTYLATLGTQPFQYLGPRQQTTYHSVCLNLRAVGTGSY